MAWSSKINRGLVRVPASLIYVVGVGYAAWMLWLGISNQLGADPVKVLEHAMGEAALYMLVLGLAVSPLRELAKLNLMKFRRAIGVTCFLFLVFHLLVWAILDVQRASEVWADIVKRPYITVGMVAFLLLLPLALTSNNLSLRKLGSAGWRKLHRLVYPAAVLGGIHFVMQAKGFQLRPIFFLLVILTLVGWRYYSRRATASSQRDQQRTA